MEFLLTLYHIIKLRFLQGFFPISRTLSAGILGLFSIFHHYGDKSRQNHHQRRQKHLSADDPPEQADTHTPESVLLHREDAAALYRAMERLDAADRELLTLHCFARLTAAELADTLHMTPAAVRQRLHRARTRLRQNMEEDGYGF